MSGLKQWIQTALQGGGAAVGGYFGGPQGAAIGSSIGSAGGSLFAGNSGSGAFTPFSSLNAGQQGDVNQALAANPSLSALQGQVSGVDAVSPGDSLGAQMDPLMQAYLQTFKPNPLLATAAALGPAAQLLGRDYLPKQIGPQAPSPGRSTGAPPPLQLPQTTGPTEPLQTAALIEQLL